MNLHININYLWIFGLIATFFASFSLTNVIRLKASVLDIPNDRSSHSIAKPKGGGLSFVICFLISLPLLTYYNLLDSRFFLAFFCSGLVISLIGFFDDVKNLPAKSRLIVQFIVASLVIFTLNGMPHIYWLGFINSKILLNVCGVIYIVWMINLYNFMDGIDAIAGLQALFLCLSMSLIYFVCSYNELALLPLILAFAVGGFIYWNLPPAKIFMGDVGSGFLGLIFAILSLQSAFVDIKLFSSFLILLGVFIIDTAVTLVARTIRGESFFQAHCTHLYQKLAKYYNNHAQVVILMLLINLLWLFPWALLVGKGVVFELWGVFLSYTPLFVMHIVLQKKIS